MRRSHIVLAVLLSAATLMGACAAPSAPADPPPPGPAPAAAAFPVTVDHAFGSTTVPAPPQRIVTAGYTEQDIVLALGATPVGVTEWYGDQPHATWPWAQDELGGATPEVLENIDGPQFERIAALEPDLIVAVNAGLDQADYETLSAIAPTVAQPAGELAVFAPWDELTLQVGRAMGREQQARELVDGIKADFDAAAAAHPEFAGVPAIFLQAPFYEGRAIAYQDGLSTAFLTDLGFVVPAELAAFAPEDGSAQAYIPMEQLGVLNAGEVLVWATEDDQARAQMEAEPIYRGLTPVREGNLVFTDGVLAGAIYFATPLSLPYVLEHLVPLLENAVAGDPSTVPAQP
ncbi:ABC transporter substrate-binding protein [Pseudonocardia sichuanensis]|uniref:ABC transporter substrate-binding protein n=1 Tax=Pseudonocardia kunmingensis TaxID=630975 RepID=UPI001B85C62A|nr:ABC transporter substrate-binding protein [Pseudonocardia kunmingensis]